MTAQYSAPPPEPGEMHDPPLGRAVGAIVIIDAGITDDTPRVGRPGHKSRTGPPSSDRSSDGAPARSSRRRIAWARPSTPRASGHEQVVGRKAARDPIDRCLTVEREALVHRSGPDGKAAKGRRISRLALGDRCLVGILPR